MLQQSTISEVNHSNQYTGPSTSISVQLIPLSQPVTQSNPMPQEGSFTLASDFTEALLDLYDVKRTAEENGSVVPEMVLVHSAEDVLRAMYAADPRPFTIYPMPDGDIAIDAHSPQGTKLVVMCEPNGGARCLFYHNDKFTRKEYSNLGIIPDNFIREALSKTRVSSNNSAS